MPFSFACFNRCSSWAGGWGRFAAGRHWGGHAIQTRFLRRCHQVSLSHCWGGGGGCYWHMCGGSQVTRHLGKLAPGWHWGGHTIHTRLLQWCHQVGLCQWGEGAWNERTFKETCVCRNEGRTCLGECYSDQVGSQSLCIKCGGRVIPPPPPPQALYPTEDMF